MYLRQAESKRIAKTRDFCFNVWLESPVVLQYKIWGIRKKLEALACRNSEELKRLI